MSDITVSGNVTADPELRFTPSGAAVANFTVAVQQRTKQGDQWVDGETMFLNCSVWRGQAENVAESITKGMRVIVTGRLKSRSYEANDGSKRTVFEVEASEVGPSLLFATAKIAKAGGLGNKSEPQKRLAPGKTARSTDPWASERAKPEADSDPWGRS